MAQGAIVLLLFAFMMCLSCLSSSAVGTGVFYACSDGTMSPGDFDFKKCTNFGFGDVLSGTEAITGLDVSTDDPEPTTTSESLTLVPTGLEEEVDPNATYLDFFGAGTTGKLSGLGVVAGATSKTECAKICYNNEVPMRGEGEECNGFVSDGFSKCVLYPSPDTVAGVSLPTSEKSYALKASRSGQSFIAFSKQNFVTDFVNDGLSGEDGSNGDFGTTSFMGANTDVTCEKDGTFGLLSGFKSTMQGGKVGFQYSCLLGDSVQVKPSVETTKGNQGQRNSCGGKQQPSWSRFNGSDIGFLRNHEVNCLNSFIQSWGVRQEGGWKNGTMKVRFNCTRLETPDTTECIDNETDGDFGERPCKLSNLRNSQVQCPTNMALTQFRINYPSGKISYRCCPKPTEGSATTYSRTVTRSNAQQAEAAAATVTPSRCEHTLGRTGGTYQSEICLSKTSESACTPTYCTWGPATY
jgi:hypothetical protein